MATAETSDEALAQRVLVYSAAGALLGTYFAFVIAIGSAVAQ